MFSSINVVSKQATMFIESCKEPHLYKFYVSHWCIVSSPRQGSNNSCISTISLTVPLRYLSKERVNDLFLINEAKSLPSFVKRTIFRQRDHFVYILPHSACPSPSGFDPTILKELSREASQECTPLVRWSVELRHSSAMPHCIESATVINYGEILLKAGEACQF